VSEGDAMRQVSIEKLFAENQQRLGLNWLAGRQGGNRVLIGEAALKPTIGQVGHMNFIHPFRIQMVGAAEAAYLRGLPDFTNSMNPSGDAELNYKGVTAMFRHVFNMAHVKTAFAAENGKVYEVDLARLFGIAKKAGYRGYFSMEADMPGDPFVNTQKLVDATMRYLS